MAKSNGKAKKKIDAFLSQRLRQLGEMESCWAETYVVPSPELKTRGDAYAWLMEEATGWADAVYVLSQIGGHDEVVAQIGTDLRELIRVATGALVTGQREHMKFFPHERHGNLLVATRDVMVVGEDDPIGAEFRQEVAARLIQSVCTPDPSSLGEKL